MEKTYIISGKPTPWKRALLNNNTFFDGQKKQKIVNGIEIRSQHNSDIFFTGPLELDITFYFKLTEKKEKTLKDNKMLFHFQRPDLSNLIKYIEDMVQSIIYHDDCLIARIKAKKCYDKEQRTEFTIRTLE